MSPDNLTNYVPYNKLIKNTDEFKKLFYSYIQNDLELVQEMGEIIPFEKLLDFLYVFAGRTLKIPETKVMLNCLRDLDVYYSLQEKSNPQEITRLAQKYSVQTEKIKAIEYTIKSFLAIKESLISPE